MPILQLSIAEGVLLLIGSISAIGGSLVAIARVDIKRTIVQRLSGPGVHCHCAADSRAGAALLFSHAVSEACWR